jgi:hypothetical protein
MRVTRGSRRFRVGHHGAELEHVEMAPVHADAGLLEQDRAAGGELDQQADDDEERQQQPERDGGRDDIEQTLHRDL